MPLNAVTYHDADPAEGTPILTIGDVVDPVVLSLLHMNGIKAEKVTEWLDHRATEAGSPLLPFACGKDRGLILVSAAVTASADDIRMRVAEAAALANRLGWVRPWLLVADSHLSFEMRLAALEGLAMATYRYEIAPTGVPYRLPAAEYRTLEGAEALLARAEARIAAMTLVRDLVMTPANMLGPAEFAQRLSDLQMVGMTLEDHMPEDLGMGALAAVGAGSPRTPRFCVLRYDGSSGVRRPIALVGKGVCFDAGGTSAKPAKGLWRMKGDMAGAAAVAGTMLELALLRADINVVALFPLAENLSGGSAARPGDVVVCRSGARIEVLDTDYEGRLLLADALHYAEHEIEADTCISVATLSNTVVDALGTDCAGFFANDEELAADLAAASGTSGESLWRLPLSPAFDKMMQSEVADVRNMPDHDLGAPCYAARFLERFAGSMRWGHVEIMGPALSGGSGDPRFPVWATGFGSRLLGDWLGIVATRRPAESGISDRGRFPTR